VPDCCLPDPKGLVSSVMDKGSVAGRRRAGTEHKDPERTAAGGSKSLTGRVIARATPMARALSV